MSLPHATQRLTEAPCLPTRPDITFHRVTDDSSAPRYRQDDVLLVGGDGELIGFVPRGSWRWFLEAMGVK